MSGSELLYPSNLTRKIDKEKVAETKLKRNEPLSLLFPKNISEEEHLKAIYYDAMIHQQNKKKGKQI